MSTCGPRDCVACKFTLKADLVKAVNDYSQNPGLGIITQGPMDCWDVSDITDMSNLFYNKSINEPIGCWNVSKVTTMRDMFRLAGNFNQFLGNWSVGKVTDMNGMFYGATKFNQDLCAWYNKSLSLPTVTDMFVNSGCTERADPNLRSKTSFCQACSCSGGKLCLSCYIIVPKYI
jgi:hypothetical protein